MKENPCKWSAEQDNRHETFCATACLSIDVSLTKIPSDQSLLLSDIFLKISYYSNRKKYQRKKETQVQHTTLMKKVEQNEESKQHVVHIGTGM